MAYIEPFQFLSAKVASISDPTPRTRMIRLQTADDYSFYPGQYCGIRLRDDKGRSIIRAYSFSSAPSSGNIEFTVGLSGGVVSSWIQQLKPGDDIEISQPFGGLVWRQDQNPLLLIAGGIGVAPLMSIWREHRLVSAISPIHMIYSARTMSDICYAGELNPARPHESLSIHLTRDTQIDKNMRSGRIDRRDIKAAYTPDSLVYICGLRQFVTDMSHAAQEAGIPRTNILVELFE